MSIAELIFQAEALTQWLHENTNDKSFADTTRSKTGLAILQLTMDIADAIIVLLENRLPGPALSLGRPLFEGYVRGIWLLHYASEAQIESFNDRKVPQFPALIKAIGVDAESGGAWIDETKRKDLPGFHDLTHGGSEHVKRRSAAGVIEPCYPETELDELVKLGIEVRIRIGAELLYLLGDKAAIVELSQRAEALRALQSHDAGVGSLSEPVRDC